MFSEDMFRNRASRDNIWWTTGKVSQEYENAKSRLFLEDFYNYVANTEVNRAMLLIGPRRIGKTWLLQHTIRRLLEKGVVSPKQIMFFSIDIPVYNGMSLEELLVEGGKIAKVDVRRDRLYVFFDEIQYLRNWENHLKTLVDTYPNVRFVASGSAASVLGRGVIESGAGRISDHVLPPLSFKEYLILKGQDGVPEQREIADGVTVPEVEDLEAFNRTFLEYVNFGGYPELVFKATEKEDVKRYIQRDIVDKVLLKDLPSLYNIRDVRELQSFFSYLVFHSGMVQSLEALSVGSGIPKYAISQSIGYLEEAFLISRLDRVDINARKLQRATQFKLYLSNPSLRAAMFQPVDPTQEPYFGHLMETAVSAQFGIGGMRENLRYANWKVGKGQHEVDFVRMDPGTQRPVDALEVKWSDGPFDHPADLSGAISFLKQHGLKRLTVTTRSQTGVKRVGDIEIVYIPTSLYAASMASEFLAR